MQKEGEKNNQQKNQKDIFYPLNTLYKCYLEFNLNTENTSSVWMFVLLFQSWLIVNILEMDYSTVALDLNKLIY